MLSIFEVGTFGFPYESFRFPGQASDERILYVTREAPIMLWMRVVVLAIAGVVMMVSVMILPDLLKIFGATSVELARLLGLVITFLFIGLGGWWLWELWRKSLFILTNRRLTKFIYTTPWNRHNLS